MLVKFIKNKIKLKINLTSECWEIPLDPLCPTQSQNNPEIIEGSKINLKLNQLELYPYTWFPTLKSTAWFSNMVGSYESHLTSFPANTRHRQVFPTWIVSDFLHIYC